MGWPAALAIASSVVGGALGLSGAKKQNQMARAEAERNRAFQKQMSDTAYSRAAKDLEKAGLNRILALGGPASSPGGNMAPVVSELGAGVNAAMGAASTASQAANLNQNTKLQNAQELQTRVAAARGAVEVGKAVEETAKVRQEKTNLKLQEGVISKQVALIESQINEVAERIETQNLTQEQIGLELKKLQATVAEAENRKRISESEAGYILTYLERISESIGGALSLITGGVVGGLIGRKTGLPGKEPIKKRVPGQSYPLSTTETNKLIERRRSRR